MCVGRIWCKKLHYGPWVVAPITMAATPVNPAGGGNLGVAALSAGVAAIVMGATTHGPQRSFFHQILPTNMRRQIQGVFMLMDQTKRF